MTCDGDNLGLSFPFDVVTLKQSSDLLRGFIAIKEWHIAVHQDEAVAEGIVCPKAFFDALDRLFTVVCKLSSFFSVRKAENEKETIHDVAVELLVVDNQDF